ncbi:MAG: hypothetical protein FWB96_07020 [Defluviitaleaceae bacterium]|nr:hypothetical protein [Defluviitaleaceae bacterium]MCL2262980.1 hypothetical protein [Defluviitaleaceae bacterium]
MSTMKTISSLQELSLPPKHQRFISEFLNNARQIDTFDKIDRDYVDTDCQATIDDLQKKV